MSLRGLGGAGGARHPGLLHGPGLEAGARRPGRGLQPGHHGQEGQVRQEEGAEGELNVTRSLDLCHCYCDISYIRQEDFFRPSFYVMLRVPPRILQRAGLESSGRIASS